MNSITDCDIAIRKYLYSNIVIAGGNSTIKGFDERLGTEIGRLAPSKAKIYVVAPPNRIESAWIGGSILGCLATF